MAAIRVFLPKIRSCINCSMASANALSLGTMNSIKPHGMRAIPIVGQGQTKLVGGLKIKNVYVGMKFA